MHQSFTFVVNDVVRNCKVSLQGDQEGKPCWQLRGTLRGLFDEHSKDFGNIKLKFFEQNFQK